MSTMVSSAPLRSRARQAGWWLGLLVVAGTAFTMRLVPVLTGGGLYGRGNYDDGVYYTAAAGFVHGLLPYRDFLLLHPPGIVVALAPFAELARWDGEPDAFAAARVAFMIIGSANAVLVAVVLRRLGIAAAFAGGLFYAVYFPAVYVEHTTMLEPLATTCLLGALALLTTASASTRWATARMVFAGVLLGVSLAIKIWGVVPVVAVIGWVLVTLGWRRAVAVTAGAAAGATVICLPFFMAAPDAMWRLVVLSQLGRPEMSGSWLHRVSTIAGLTPFPGPAPWWALVIAGTVLTLACLAASRSAVGRLSVLLLLATLAVLLATPSWFQHYAALSAAPIALVVGAAVGWVVGRVRRPATAVVAAVVAVGLLAGYAQVVITRPFGRVFPAAALASTVGASRTCVTTDDPISLIELDALQQNLSRRCPLVADLGGYNYALQVGTTNFWTRARNPQWQRVALDYLSSGDTTVVGIRFRSGYGFSKSTAHQINGWPVLETARGVSVRRPATVLTAR